MFTDPEVMRYIGPRRPMTEAEIQNWLADILHRQDSELTRYAVVIKATDELIGVVGLRVEDRVKDFGYYFRNSYLSYSLSPLIFIHAFFRFSASSSMIGLSHRMRPAHLNSFNASKRSLILKSDSARARWFFSPFGPYSIPERWMCKRFRAFFPSAF